MDVRRAVKIAKEHIAFLMEDEKIINVGLEEVEFLPEKGEWEITVGFSRPWDQPSNPSKVLEAIGQNAPPLNRTYKVVRINAADESVLSVKDRELTGHYNGF